MLNMIPVSTVQSGNKDFLFQEVQDNVCGLTACTSEYEYLQNSKFQLSTCYMYTIKNFKPNF